jgi:hypothetical protein
VQRHARRSTVKALSRSWRKITVAVLSSGDADLGLLTRLLADAALDGD